ncbi:uncharacterized protein LOC119839907 [Zerene cesonia]|uniref:uncharacterized protein LOC119839907 n=1 Tax=Zerene cesonia TaxID=33412 RepID=UPI0018E54185|nr:uncharacterized protein LOC119839907 [Zerene cesonia]
MAAVGMRPWCLVALLLIVSSTHTEAKNVTHEEIRNVMLSLVHLFHVSEMKLDRHEFREKVLGDQLKNMLQSLEKKHRALEPLNGLISRLDERVYNVESLFIQKEEKEKAKQEKTHEMLEDIQKSLQALTATLNKNLKTNTAPADVETNLTTEDDSINRRLDVTDAKLDAVKQEILSLKNSLNKDALRALCVEMVTDVNPFERHITEAEKLLNKYELKLNKYNETSSKIPTDFVPLNEVTLADEAWHNKMSEVMERQEGEIKKIQQLLSNAESMWKDLPRLADIKRATNDTLEALAVTQSNITGNEDHTVNKIVTKLREMSERLVATNKDIQQSLTQSNTMSEQAYDDIQKSYDALRNEIQSFSKNENVMLQTADDVIATKKRIEYGVNRILLEVGESIRGQGRLLNSTLLNRVDQIEKQIMGNQSLALANLTSKFESEMSQVWRQIGIMYEQLTASKKSIDKLSEQTAQYVNGSTTTLDSMKDKVGLITSRVSTVDDNLNYLLGRLSLVVQEFSQIKTGLSDALEKSHADLQEVQSKIAENGPGPHAVK